MPKAKVEESTGLPNGTYVGKCVTIEEKTAQYGPVFNFNFQILDAPEEATFTNISAFTDRKVAIGLKTYKWFVALNKGKDLDLGQEIDTDDFIGKQCTLVIENKPNSKNPDKIYPKVVNVTALRKGQEIKEDDTEKEGKKSAPVNNKAKDSEFEDTAPVSADEEDDDDF